MIRPPVYSEMLQNFYEARFVELRKARRKRLEALSTRAEAIGCVEWAKRTVRGAFGPFPERSPLNTRSLGTVEADGVTIEKLLFESRPGFFVTALLYRPSGVAGKLPAVLGLCGHSESGKAAEPYRKFCHTLARNGSLVLMPDPIGQGERKQYIGHPLEEEAPKGCCDEHNMLGKMLGLYGGNFGFWRVWDAMRALDCLLERPEADPARVGVTGNSGGGTLSSYLWALDDRITMAAPACYLTTFWRNFDNELPVDAEQAIPGLAAAGFEMADFLIARAPAPALILAKENDFFDPRGTRECFEEAHRIYRLLGAPDQLRLHFEPGDHGYTPGNRAAMYAFFAECQHLPPPPPEPEVEVPEVFCLESRNVNSLPGAIPLPAYLCEVAACPLPEVGLARIRDFLKLESPVGAPGYKVLRNGCDGKRCVSVYGVRTEPGILAFLHTLDSSPLNLVPAAGTARLVVAAEDGEEELLASPTPEEGTRLFTLDVRGSGKSRPLTGDRDGTPFTLYGTEYFYDATGLMLDSPLFQGRCRDVLATLKLLREVGCRRIVLTGVGLGGMVAACAAAVAPELVDALELDGMPGSFSDLVREGVYRWPQSFAPRGMLTLFDLPDLLRELGKGMPVTVAAPRDRNYSPLA